MTYPCHRLPPSPPQGSENWLRPPYRRGPLKRRSGSPCLFPKKVHVSEEKVAEQLGNLSIQNNEKVNAIGANTHKPDFLLDGTLKRKTFQEIEDSIEIDATDDCGGADVTVKLAPELANEIKRMSRKILTAGTYGFSGRRIPSNPCQELVLWKPPSGSIVQVLNAVRDAAASQESEEDYFYKNSGPKLDRIEEEACSDAEDYMSDEMDVNLPHTPRKLSSNVSPAFLMNPLPDPYSEHSTENTLQDFPMDMSTDS